MRKIASKIVKRAKDVKTAIFFPYGVDAEYDAECDNSFNRALDFIYYALVTSFSIYAVFVFYFFFAYMLNN